MASVFHSDSNGLYRVLSFSSTLVRSANTQQINDLLQAKMLYDQFAGISDPLIERAIQVKSGRIISLGCPTPQRNQDLLSTNR